MFIAWLFSPAEGFCIDSQFKDGKLRKKFIVDHDTFKLGITVVSEWDYKIHISKKINGVWKLQNRHVKNADNFLGYKILDWDHDGFNDLVIEFINGPTLEKESFLFLYNASTQNFVNVENYWWYCSSYDRESYIEGTDSIYISFQRWGCSGSSYLSCLFSVNNYKVLELGYAAIDYCELPFSIQIYKTNSNLTHERVVTMAGDYIQKNYSSDDKNQSWYNYMCHYWSKYYPNFMQQ